MNTIDFTVRMLLRSACETFLLVDAHRGLLARGADRRLGWMERLRVRRSETRLLQAAGDGGTVFHKLPLLTAALKQNRPTENERELMLTLTRMLAATLEAFVEVSKVWGNDAAFDAIVANFQTLNLGMDEQDDADE